jgi:hypothetical protein
VQVRAAAAQAPAEDHQFLWWWPRFKRMLGSTARRLNRQHRAESGAAVLAAEERLQALYCPLRVGGCLRAG